MIDSIRKRVFRKSQVLKSRLETNHHYTGIFQIMSLDENESGNQRLEVQRQSMVWHNPQTRNILFSCAFARLHFVQTDLSYSSISRSKD